MHFGCEIIIPPTSDIQKAVEQVLAPYDENVPTDEREWGGVAFWDWFVIGGRWDGEKILCQYDAQKVDEFWNWCKEEKITVGCVQAGKQEVKPESQIPKVDAKWNQMFPSDTLVPCPLFAHGHVSQYEHNLNGNVCTLAKLPKEMTTFRVIFAEPKCERNDEGKWVPTNVLEPAFMLAREHWNGCNFEKTDWGGNVEEAVSRYKQHLEGYNTDYSARRMPTDDWLAVTVDYHS